MAPATPAFRSDPYRDEGLRQEYRRKPNPSLGDAFAMVTGGGTLPVMGSAVMGLPTLRLPATGLRSNQDFLACHVAVRPRSVIQIIQLDHGVQVNQ